MIYVIFLCVFWHMQLYMSWYIRSFFGITFLNILYFFKYSCTNIFHRRSLYTFYGIVYRRICVLRGPTELMAVRLCLEDKHCSNNMMTSSNGKLPELLAICAGNSPVTGEFPAQRLVTRNFDSFFHLGRNKRLSKQSWGCWFETSLR